VKLVLRYFLRGLIVIVPAAITVWVLYQVFVTLDSLVGLPYPGAGVGLTLLVFRSCLRSAVSGSEATAEWTATAGRTSPPSPRASDAWFSSASFPAAPPDASASAAARRRWALTTAAQ